MSFYSKFIYLLVIFIVISQTGLSLYAQVNTGHDSTRITTTDTRTADSTQALINAPGSISDKKHWQISLSKVIFSLVIFLISFIAIKYFTRLMELIGERWGTFRLIVKRIVPVLRITGWTVVIYFIIAFILAPPIETLIAVTASAGIAIGFASQDILKNIFGGIMILFDRPFQVGDKIAIGTYYGEVIQIGLRTVRILTGDDSMVSIPNSEIVSQAVSNSNSGEFNCQVVAEFYLPAETDIVRLKKICYLAAAVSRHVYIKKPIAVILKNEITHGRSMLKVRLKAYVLDLRYEFALASEMTELVIKQLIKEKLVTAESLSFYPPATT
jgi:small-conductance mechanosensitive channel